MLENKLQWEYNITPKGQWKEIKVQFESTGDNQEHLSGPLSQRAGVCEQWFTVCPPWIASRVLSPCGTITALCHSAARAPAPSDIKLLFGKWRECSIRNKVMNEQSMLSKPELHPRPQKLFTFNWRLQLCNKSKGCLWPYFPLSLPTWLLLIAFLLTFRLRSIYLDMNLF